MKLSANAHKTYVKLIVAGVCLASLSMIATAGGPDPATAPAPKAESSATAIAADPSVEYRTGLAAYDAGEYDKARRIWLPLAEKGYMLAQRGMGKLYEKGRGVDRDFAVAIKWYRPAAEQGDAESQYRLSVGYAYGLGIKKDESLAFTWLKKAAANGQKRAQKSLARAYADGLFGVPRDPEQAKYWYDKANSGS